MLINLAGYNLDAEVIEELKKNNPGREDITPETLSASYARISRDPRPINELRQAARTEVEKARKSNKSIIFAMGHHSVAEHAVFNFDIIDVSRLAMEELEKFRLCSFTEKSQRYITLGKDYVLPEEIKGTKLEAEFKQQVLNQADLYEKLFNKLKVYVFEKYKDLAADPKNNNLLEGWAKEDARYITSLSTCAQVGMTINARNLEHLFRRFASSNLQEIKAIGRKMYELVIKIAPSIILFPEANAYDLNKYENLKKAAPKLEFKTKLKADCSLIDFTPEGDNKLIAALLFVSGNADYKNCLKTAQKMTDQEKHKLLAFANKDLLFYDTMLREYEFPDLTYDLSISAACFGQLKRHRMSTIVVQDYDPDLDITVPPAIIEIGMEKDFRKITSDAEGLYNKIKKGIPMAGVYALTNAHRRRVLIKTNARELYHISRLREDAHAQWDIREISAKMSALAKEEMPLTFGLIGGKDRFTEIKQQFIK